MAKKTMVSLSASKGQITAVSDRMWEDWKPVGRQSRSQCTPKMVSIRGLKWDSGKESMGERIPL